MSDPSPVDRLHAAGDDLYEMLLDAHRGLDADASARLNARLVLLLMGAARDPEAVRAAITSASGAL